MAYTSHGYLIPGTPAGKIPPTRMSCGGLHMCRTCRSEAKIWLGKESDLDYTLKARQMVVEFVDQRFLERNRDEPMPVYEAFVMRFAHTLGNWSALVSTTLEDGMYYEITHDSHKHETKIVAYKRVDQKVIPD